MEENRDLELEALMQEPPTGNKKKKRRKWSKRRKIVVVVAVLLVFVIGIINVMGANKPVGIMVTTTTMKQDLIQNKLSLSGPISGTDSAEVVSNLHAEIEEILVKEGG